MPTRLLGTDVSTFSGIKLTKYVNDAQGSDFDDIAEAVTGLGVGVVATSLFPPMAATIATALGLGLATKGVVDAITKALDDNDLGSMIERMKEGDELKVTTEFYEWSSSSGNHYTWYAEEIFEILTDELFPNAKTLDIDECYRSAGISEEGEEDYFKFTVTKKDYYVIETKGSTDVYGELYNSNGRKLESDDDDGPGTNFKIREYLDPGTYYIKVYGYRHRETGLYLIKVETD